MEVLGESKTVKYPTSIVSDSEVEGPLSNLEKPDKANSFGALP